MSNGQLEMEQIKAEVKNIREEVRQNNDTLTKNVDKLVNSIAELVTSQKVSEEKDRRQQEINESLLLNFKEVDKRVDKIELERAEEKPSRQFLMKWWPWLFVGMVILLSVVTSLSSMYGKNLIN